MKKYSSTTCELIDLVNSGAELKDLLVKSIAKARSTNPDKDTNPAQSLEEFYDFIEWSLTTLPRFILRLPEGSSLYDHMDQGVNYLYFLVDQPLEELEDKGYYYPSLQYHEPLHPGLKIIARLGANSCQLPNRGRANMPKIFIQTPSSELSRAGMSHQIIGKATTTFSPANLAMLLKGLLPLHQIIPY